MFSSCFLLIGILPWLLLFYRYAAANDRVRRVSVVLFNAFFLLAGGPYALPFVLAYVVCVWAFAQGVAASKNKILFAVSVALTSLPLLFFKYTHAIVESANSMFGDGLFQAWAAPIGMSFITFEAVSLLADVYCGRISGRVGFPQVFMYLAFFPTTLSGPILRFNDFSGDLAAPYRPTDTLYSVERFVVGFCKKMIVANKLLPLANFYFDEAARGADVSTAGLWVGSIAYTLQLYFDFSGYTDMAIGVGGLLGFRMKENFNRPYRAHSIGDFWKRWHITLCDWFRDYIYIPLGGNRCRVPRHLLNLLIVWLVTGMWHGNDWTFVLWGLGYFCLLVFEKYAPFVKKIENTVWGHLYALFFINLLWVLFRADSLAAFAAYVKGMFGGGTWGIERIALGYLPFLACCAALCLPWDKWLRRFEDNRWLLAAKYMALAVLFVWAVFSFINSSHISYIYGNF